jgi:ribosomal protein L7Ae-like RNA K-turn-binding protein
VDATTERRVLGLIGLGIRARNAVVGVERVRRAARSGRLALAVVAPDASRHSRDKVLPLLAARGVRVIEGPGTAALGTVVGRDSAVAVGITNAALARGIKDILGSRGRDSRDGNAGPRRASPVSRPVGRRVG